MFFPSSLLPNCAITRKFARKILPRLFESKTTEGTVFLETFVV